MRISVNRRGWTALLIALAILAVLVRIVRTIPHGIQPHHLH
jgi:hypothetical protein